jgi:thioredoxin-related protein
MITTFVHNIIFRTELCAMRKIFLFSLIILISGFAHAQTSPRSGASLNSTSRSGSNTGSRSDGNQSRSSQQSTSRESGNTNSGSSRTLGIRKAPTVSYGNTNLQPYNTTRTDGTSGNARSVVSRPSKSYGSDNTAKTAKSVTTPNKKVAALKPVEVVKINWMTIGEAVEKSKTEKRKIYIDIYTDWCGWCKHMDSTTFVTPAVANYINEHYYAVKFNAEQTGDVVFKDKTYRFKKEGNRGYHELAAEWLNNRFTFPTAVFLDENLNSIQPISGYLDGAKMEAILNYFGTNSHKTTPWETYEKRFTNAKNGNGR